ncbi:MAG TPA: luciferase family protein [Acidimicrobiales bacterium]
MTDWQIDFLERCSALVDGVALGDGAFAPGPALWVGKREVAHFDGERTVDVRLTKTLIRSRRDELHSDDRVSLRRGSSDWLAIEVRSNDDAELARGLVRDAIAANLPTAPPGLPPAGADLERRRGFH